MGSAAKPPASPGLQLPPPSPASASSFRGLRVVDLCAGLGGFSIAARMLGMTPVAAIDNWPVATSTYQANFPDAHVETGSLNDSDTRRKLFREVSREGIDVLMAGPPCQGFTQMRNGNRISKDKRIAVTHAVVRAIRETAPRGFVIENVPAMARHHKGEFLRKLMAKLARPRDGLEYSVVAKIVNAAEYGVPQQRRRIILVGTQGMAKMRFPETTDLSPYFSARRRGMEINSFSKEADAILLDDADDRLVTVRQALGDLPRLDAGAQDSSLPYATAPMNPYQSRMREGSSNATWVQTPRILPKTARRVTMLEPGECLADLAVEKRRSLKRQYYSAYRRLHPDVPSTTLFTKIDCAYHFEFARALSVREYARLQSIPDSHVFPTSARNAYAMIGNSVPPLMIARLLAAGLEI